MDYSIQVLDEWIPPRINTINKRMAQKIISSWEKIIFFIKTSWKLNNINIGCTYYMKAINFMKKCNYFCWKEKRIIIMYYIMYNYYMYYLLLFIYHLWQWISRIKIIILGNKFRNWYSFFSGIYQKYVSESSNFISVLFMWNYFC